jgi:hypothetical protein
MSETQNKAITSVHFTEGCCSGWQTETAAITGLLAIKNKSKMIRGVKLKKKSTI